MTPREKVFSAWNHSEVYPVPTDVWENGIHPDLEARLCEHFGLERDEHVGVLEALNAHFRWAGPIYAGPPLEEATFELPVSFPFLKIAKNIWGVWEGMETYSDNVIERPLAKAQSIADVQAHSWPNPDWFDYSRLGWFYDGFASTYAVNEWSEMNQDYVRLVGGWNPVFSRVMDLIGMEQGLMNLASNPKVIEATVEHIGRFLEQFYERLATSCEDRAEVLSFGDDFACQANMLLAPDQWRRIFLPLWRRLFAIAHKHNMKSMMHMCGAVRPVLGDLIDAGLDIYEVVQVTANGMEPEGLKRDFGKDLVFYGGMDVQHLLPNGTTDEVRCQVRRMIDVLGKDGGYILASMHFLMDDLPTENVLAMYDEAQKYKAGN